MNRDWILTQQPPLRTLEMYSADRTRIIQVYSDKRQGLISEQVKQDDEVEKRDKESVI